MIGEILCKLGFHNTWSYTSTAKTPPEKVGLNPLKRGKVTTRKTMTECVRCDYEEVQYELR